MSGLDLSKITDGSTSDSAIEPRRIFSALPSKDAKYGYARDVQSEVWQAWHERRTERDLVIKMNTGGGKTVVGLVALKSALNEKIGPAVYVAPDKYLAKQVCEEADHLGIETATDPDSSKFRQGRAILVVNIFTLFNGRTRFGLQGSSREPIELGAVLIDDAHACLATVEDQFTLRVPAGHEAYKELFELFSEDLSAQSAAKHLELREDSESFAVLQVASWAWADKQDEVLRLLHPHRDDDDFKFAWPLISEVLPLCDAAFSSEALEVAPPCPPVEMVPSFAAAKRRLYLTATLADDSVVVTHFAASPTTIKEPITPKSADDLGDRMILTPLQTFAGSDEDDVKGLTAQEATQLNVVVIAPSWNRASYWEDVSEGTYGAGELPDVLGRLRGEHVGLVVLVNKYDGIDLPGDACHLLVVDGLPEALGTLERMRAIVLQGSDTLLTEQIQRIEQGMGRGVRSNDDFCVVILMGRRLTHRLNQPSAREKFSPATRAQLDLSDQIAEQLEEQTMDELPAAMDQCLQRDTDWVSASRGILSGLTFPDEVAVSETAVAEREAFDLAVRGNFPEAVGVLQSAVDETADRQMRGLLKQRMAAYQHRVDPVEAQQIQKSAHTDNKALLRPRRGISYTRLAARAGTQAKGAAQFFAQRYGGPNDLILGVDALLDDLRPRADVGAVARFEEAMRQLGLHLGFGSERPEQELGNGPDVLWSLERLTYCVIECKSGATTSSISRDDAAQLSHSVDWFVANYGEDCTATPLLIHPTRKLHEKASAREGTRVLTFTKLEKLRNAVRTFAGALASSDSLEDEKAIQEQLVASGLNAAAFLERWTMDTRST